MLEIIKQEELITEGNDCLIMNCYVILKCHDKYIVMNIRRYNGGWCDNDIDFRGRKEFDNLNESIRYYTTDLINM